MPETFEFASPGWLRCLCDLVEKQIAASGVDLAGVDYVFGEEFVNVPERLRPAGAERVGWVVRVVDGSVSATSDVPPADADSNNIADWGAIEHLAHHRFGLDADRDAEMLADAAAHEAAGRLERIVRRKMPRALGQALGGQHHIHNAVVDITGPRLS